MSKLLNPGETHFDTFYLNTTYHFHTYFFSVILVSHYNGGNHIVIKHIDVYTTTQTRKLQTATVFLPSLSL